MAARKIDAMHKLFSATEWLTCKGCKHLITGRYHDRIYHKCELYGMSHSEATDWRLSYTACGLYNMHVKRSTWVPVMDRIVDRRTEPPIDGQMTMEMAHGQGQV